MRPMKEHELKLALLRQALQEGEGSGFTDYSLSEMIRELDDENG